MPYIIDGHNLIGHLRSGALSDPDDERMLLERLAPLANRLRRRMIVFFDRGIPAPGRKALRYGQVEARFIPLPAKADDAILAYLREKKDSRNYIVVTSDSEVGTRARRCGARVVAAGEFLREIQSVSDRTRKEKPPEDPEEVDEWLRLFGG